VAVWRSPAEVPSDLGRTVVTIGVFDGVHRGHQVVVGQAAKLAGELGLPTVAVTFDPNPMAVIRPEIAPPALLSVSRRAELLRLAGVDHVLILPFGRERSEQSAEDFVDDVLVSVLGARAVVVGGDFRFGHRAAGNVTLLGELGKDRGFVTEVVDAVGDGGVPRWSSTYVRERVAAGDVAAAAEALGRPYRVEGVVIHGAQRGRELGFPTANIPVGADELAPADGVYAGWLTRLDDPAAGPLPAAISVGTNPTFDGTERHVEPYVLDRDDLDLYGVAVAVDFVAWIRGQERFDTVEALIAQIQDDVEQTRHLLQNDHAG
jgi:riboflavin kinase / FMN adenylyltransferase